jgi:trimeric autotransporter adhesin
VLALAVSGSNVYAGGSVARDGSLAAKWNGSSWSALGPFTGGLKFPTVSALAASGNDLYVGGEISSAGGTPVASIAKWNGSTWSALGSGVNGYVYALVVSESDLYAGGTFTTAGGKPTGRAAKARIRSAAESITASGSTATIQFSGVVGYEYHVQRTDSLTPPMTWTTLTTTPLSPADDGSLTFTDTTAPPATAWYRLVQH